MKRETSLKPKFFGYFYSLGVTSPSDFIYWREKKVGVICIPPLFMHLGVSVRQHITFFSVPIIGNFVYNKEKL